MVAAETKARNRIRPIIIQGHERPLTMVKYNREGDLLFTAAKDYRPCMWYADNGERIGTFEGHTGTVWCLDVNCALRPFRVSTIFPRAAFQNPGPKAVTTHKIWKPSPTRFSLSLSSPCCPRRR